VRTPTQQDFSTLAIFNKPATLLILFCTFFAMSAQAQTFSTLFDFSGTEGASPVGALVQGIDGNLYGVTSKGGSSHACQGVTGCGTIFKTTTDGTVSTVHVFDITDGSHPAAAPIQGADGNFYGTTSSGGLHVVDGTIYSLALDGTLTTIHNFSIPGGANPSGALVQGADGNLYGTAHYGGTNLSGTVFKSSTAGATARLYNFCPVTGCADGQAPTDGLIQGTDGNFYGTTSVGGAHGHGTVFKMTPSGTLTTLYSFCAVAPNCADGATPNVPLVELGGVLYGTAYQGGAHASGTIFSITVAGTMNILHSLCAQPGCADGSNPLAGLTLGNDGGLYGTTSAGGSSSRGTIFKAGTGGGFTTEYTFQATDGQFPGQLLQATDGNFYGALQIAGASGAGSVFRLSTGLAPFVKTLQASGRVGASIVILGTDLTGATKVSFNGRTASFTVESATEIVAKVPGGATTGTVQVVTPGGTLSSSTPFSVP
jgi:uncharacterized repeat protein (TIGR03803 family)